jgi:hypothetical protein
LDAGTHHSTDFKDSLFDYRACPNYLFPSLILIFPLLTLVRLSPKLLVHQRACMLEVCPSCEGFRQCMPQSQSVCNLLRNLRNLCNLLLPGIQSWPSYLQSQSYLDMIYTLSHR